ncbi:MAG: hypothetical protein CMJ46_12875 [Planctomyces sp.]|nr:hypothetical protein [Planctomyces sp.]
MRMMLVAMLVGMAMMLMSNVMMVLDALFTRSGLLGDLMRMMMERVVGDYGYHHSRRITDQHRQTGKVSEHDRLRVRINGIPSVKFPATQAGIDGSTIRNGESFAANCTHLIKER